MGCCITFHPQTLSQMWTLSHFYSVSASPSLPASVLVYLWSACIVIVIYTSSFESLVCIISHGTFIVLSFMSTAELCHPVFLVSIYQGGLLKTIKLILFLKIAIWPLLLAVYLLPITHVFQISTNVSFWKPVLFLFNFVHFMESILEQTLLISPTLAYFSLQKKNKQKMYSLIRVIAGSMIATKYMMFKYPA